MSVDTEMINEPEVMAELRSLYPQYRPVELGGLTFYNKGMARFPGTAASHRV